MSYIRCLSNPESLYVFDTQTRSGKSATEILHCIDPPLASAGRQPILVPTRAFREVCRAWANGARDVTRRGLRVREVHVFADTGRRVPQRRSVRQMFDDAARSRYVVRLTYGRHWFCMWPVTWAYIVGN